MPFRIALRSQRGEASTAYVTFMHEELRRTVFDNLIPADRLSGGGEDREHHYERAQNRDCGFSWKLENPLAIQEEFQRMMDYVINVWIQIGGWNKLQ